MSGAELVGVILGARFWGWLLSLPFREQRGEPSFFSALVGALCAAVLALLVSGAAGRPDLGLWYLPALAGWLVGDALRARQAQQAHRARKRPLRRSRK